MEWQLRLAAGEELGFAREDVRLTGHAVEARLCAEDPTRGFLPSGGTVLRLHEPDGDGVRTDSGLSEGAEVGSLYDLDAVQGDRVRPRPSPPPCASSGRPWPGR
ncbi:hypothetical protein LV779_03615 [Streptomyces thinghirensis]|nr:hypothetical protein [Streptomyces thinghirensis]